MALLKALRSRLHPYDVSEPYPEATDGAAIAQMLSPEGPMLAYELIVAAADWHDDSRLSSAAAYGSV